MAEIATKLLNRLPESNRYKERPKSRDFHLEYVVDLPPQNSVSY